MKGIICVLSLTLLTLLGDYNIQKVEQTPITNIEAGTKTTLDVNTKAGEEVADDKAEAWRVNAMETFHNMYQSEENGGGYALSNEELADSNNNTDCGLARICGF